MPIDDRTANRSYKLPAAGNFLGDDITRLRDALNAIDADIFARYTKVEVDQLITNLIQGAPGALDTLNELAEAMGDDPNFAATVTNLLAQKANSADVFSKAESDARYVQGQVQTEMVFIATANQSEFTLSTAVINKPSALVTIDGVVQPTSEYSLNMAGTVLTLSEGVPAGTIVRVLALGVSSQGAPADDTVTTPKLRDGAVTPAKLAQPLTRRTAVQASGTAVDFTGIPSWAKKLTVILNGLSTNGTSPIVILLGTSAGLQSLAYTGSVFNETTVAAPAGVNYPTNTGFPLVYTWDLYGRLIGHIDFINIESAIWVASGQFARDDGPGFHRTAGAKDLNGVLDRIRITTVNGTDVFDYGGINLLIQ
jgi:hypothetical protein